MHCRPAGSPLIRVMPFPGWRDTENGGTLLHVAVVEENNFGANVTRLLIKAGVDVNKTDVTGTIDLQ